MAAARIAPGLRILLLGFGCLLAPAGRALHARVSHAGARFPRAELMRKDPLYDWVGNASCAFANRGRTEACPYQAEQRRTHVQVMQARAFLI